ncbi:MAG: helix-turn-helix transcriptional regulator [Clostridia bacterium]|nr:helix-turn-helix transcriptional regulator [Clostridia bacterium]
MPEQNTVEICEFLCAHESVIAEVRAHMPDEDTLFELAEFYKVFGDSTRIRILTVLRRHEMCVCDLATILTMNQSAISHQLRILKQARLISARREGKQVFYSLTDDHVHQLLDTAIRHIAER